MYDFVSDYTCTIKFNVMLNRDGNILQEGETPASQKNYICARVYLQKFFAKVKSVGFPQFNVKED